MSDLVTDEELSRRGYRDTGYHSYSVSGFPRVLTDSVTYWTSEKEHGDELWVGELLSD